MAGSVDLELQSGYTATESALNLPACSPSSPVLDWVPEALQACQDASAVHKADDAWMLPSRGNLLKLWYHLSAAEFCVQNRLKTPPHKKPEVRWIDATRG